MHNVISQRGERYQFDVIVIGSGIAGLSYCLELLKIKPQCRIALLCKGKLDDSNTNYAQGGIAAANSLDDVRAHIADTLSAGDGLCHEQTVTDVVSQGLESIQYLLNHGVAFDRNDDNQLACGKEAGHSSRRIYHVGDQTGAAIVKALIMQLKQHAQVTVFEEHTAVNLITQSAPHQPASFPEVIGVYVLAEKSGLIHTFLANAVVLATGGAGKVYRYTTNPNVATGDGVAMAHRAGARVSGMEFYQFHPTLFYHPKIHNFLISEALRGEGAYLRSPETGERFMQRYAPDKMELATRDVVARAIFCEIEQGIHDYVYLDIRHRDKEFLEKRFPMICQTLKTVGLDLSKDLIPVVPAAHYMGGGVLSDLSGNTDLRRLYAVGETAYTGLHGANRLASNSLLEGIIMGRQAAQASCEAVMQTVVANISIRDWDSTSVVDLRRASQINVHWRGLRGEMSSYAGIVRTEAGLRDQLNLVLARREMIEEYYWKYTITRDLVELRNITLIAELIVRAALGRRESRGGHYREDFSEKVNEYSRVES
jgi:L-aspartate oxidase